MNPRLRQRATSFSMSTGIMYLAKSRDENTGRGLRRWRRTEYRGSSTECRTCKAVDGDEVNPDHFTQEIDQRSSKQRVHQRNLAVGSRADDMNRTRILP